YQFLGAGGGGGGGGAVGGSGGAWGPDGTIPNCKKFQYFSGKEFSSYSGNSGTTTNGGQGGQGAKVKITNWAGNQWQWPYGGTGGKGGAAGGDCRTKEVQLLYQVSIEVEEETIGVYDASADAFLPASLAVPTKAGHTFEGFYAGDVAYYDASGARTPAKITADTTISAKFTTNSYHIGIESADGSTGGGAGVSGPVNYGDAITLTTPTRAGYLFRGWKISATNGSINQAAYYTYTVAARMRTSGQVSENFIYGNGAAMTAGFEKIGDSITVYNLSADDDARIKIEEMWARDSFTVTFKDFDGTTIGTVNGTYGTAVNVPVLPDHRNEYYTYTFKYWKCNIDDQCYTTEQLPALGAFLDWESSKGDQVYNGVTFTAVYETTYHKEIEFTGSLGNTLNGDGKLVLNSTDTNVEIITNFKITKNDGVAALLLIPEYDANVFSIKAISVNGKQFGAGVSSSEVLDGFDVTVTKDLNSPVKILLDNILPDKTTSNEIFIQIIYVMNNAVGGEYQFGFVTNNPTNTDEITHGDRSEAYGTYDPDANDQTDAYKFNELKISVNSSAIQVVIRANGEITIAPNQSFVYNGQQMSAADITEMIERALQYTYNGFTKDKNAVTIKWYDAQGNQLSGAPKNAGTYKIGISAAETTYYTAAAEVQATFTITPYQIFVSAGDQSVVYNGSNATINTSAAGAGIYIKDVQGNLISADDFVYQEVTLTGVKLQNRYIDAGTYTNAIRGVLSCNSNNYK
ncbi:MAG: InlB B-repeat-containing protein, partial [Oscillospiraceae bacterium]|nr:InlB B-repeat-containing protein [Oscillospiraceae bacterium]